MKKLNYLFLLCMMALSAWSYGQPANNDCAGAIDLSSSLGQGLATATTGPYDNTTATTEASDPTTGYECFGEPTGYATAPSLENTLWFKITGDGGVYFIEATTEGCTVGTGIDVNDTQIAVYGGSCGTLTPIACNEDGSNATNTPPNYPAALDLQTEAGTEYYIMVDGFNFNGTLADGEFCMQITQKPTSCDDPNLSGGTASVEDNIICQGELTNIEVTGALAPIEGILSGYAWVISTSDLQSNPDFTNNPTLIAGFNVNDNPVSLEFDQSGFADTSPTGNYFYTLVVFGNATWAAGSQEMYLSEVITDPNCTYLSNSIEIEYYETEFCPDSMVNVLDVDKEILGMTIFPNPVQDVINLNITVNEQHTDSRLMITNITGQIIKEQRVSLINGVNTLSMDVNDMPSGIYMVSIESDTHQSVNRFVKR